MTKAKEKINKMLEKIFKYGRHKPRKKKKQNRENEG